MISGIRNLKERKLEDFISNKYAIKSGKHQLNNIDNNKISSNDLKLAELIISQKLFALINNYREKIQSRQCVGNSILQKSADIRSQELQEKLDHIRPNGVEGSQLPYSFKYPKQNQVEGEAIGQLASISLVFLINKGAKTAFDMLINNSPEFLVGSQANEQAVGVCIKHKSEEFVMTFEYICSKAYLNNGENSFLSDKTQLVKLYNAACELTEADYERNSWGQLMLMRSKAKQIYDEGQVSQVKINQTVEECMVTLANLKKVR